MARGFGDAPMVAHTRGCLEMQTRRIPEPALGSQRPNPEKKLGPRASDRFSVIDNNLRKTYSSHFPVAIVWAKHKTRGY